MEGSWRSHQIPLTAPRTNPDHLRQLDAWLRSYRPEELFDADGRPTSIVAGVAPAGRRRMGANPHANGGRLLRPCDCRTFGNTASTVTHPGAVDAEDTRVLGRFLRDVITANAETRNFRIVGPDETASNRLDAVFEVTSRQWLGARATG